MSLIQLGEAQVQRRTLTVPPLAAVATGTRDVDYMEVFRAPSDQTARVKSVKFSPNATQAAVGTNYVDLRMVKIFGTTVAAVGNTITTNTAGGWTALTEQDLITITHNVILRPNERLALRIDNVANGVASFGFSLHSEYEIGK